MIAWSVELSKFGIQYESRGPLKAQCLADFVAELTPTTAEEPQVLTLHIDRSSNSKGGGAGIILEGPNQVTLELLYMYVGVEGVTRSGGTWRSTSTTWWSRPPRQ
uniref:RNase H type-1 domain-containing protein n=1 Tax=Cajanus cajan TaxID=3821 RepID=A0A151QMY9_CAJCA|nr:hypothetical protein KK1_047891 [Cajanus cajan]